ncbi:MAG: DoxX family protein [Candidatus Omnitrophota bacterium]
MKKESRIDLAMLLIRLSVGCVFVAHGSQKLFGLFNGIGLEGTARIVEGLGFHYAYVTAGIWGGVEFAGGIFIILGILVRFSSGAIAVTMLIRMFKINLAYGFFFHNGGIEYNILVIAACIPLMLIGGGRWSVWDS